MYNESFFPLFFSIQGIQQKVIQLVNQSQDLLGRANMIACSVSIARL